MKNFPVQCVNCKSILYRSGSRIKESQKHSWKTYCSITCQSKIKNTQQTFKCSNLKCPKTFTRQTAQIRSASLYCSRACAVTINNTLFPKRIAVIKICLVCNQQFTNREKYCSVSCMNQNHTLSKGFIIEKIKAFYKKTERIPFKREFQHTKAARNRFGSWNNAIKAAGFIPNPVMFAKKYTGKDGHKCDSLAEKIIDDWLYTRKIDHRRSVAYPNKSTFTVDFVVGDYWIEFFGLHGQLNRYDELRKEKLRLIRQYKLKFIEILPKHLFPRNKLQETLTVLSKS